MGSLRSKGRDSDVIPLALPVAQFQAHEAEISAAVKRVMAGGSYILGAELEQFETAFASFCGAKHAIGVGSGTDALTLALRAYDIGHGDEVITTSHTAIATVAAITATGATPVFVDIDPNHYVLDPARIGSAVTKRSRALVPVHLYGHPADVTSILAAARRFGLKVIEDCAQAAGATYGNRRVGTLGTAGCFSFYPTKNLGAIGDGGMIVTSSEKLATRLRRLRQYGWDAHRKPRETGLNSRLDPLQAAILNVKLNYLEADNRRRAVIAARYDAGLSGLPVVTPATTSNATHVYHLYVIACRDRDALRAHLSNAGIQTAIHYPVPAHRQKPYADRSRISREGVGVTDRTVRRILSLPIYPEIADETVDRVILAIRDYYEVRGRKPRAEPRAEGKP
jgi:dTDP-4-amino-4,6-dideoxygalactose transaminase